MLGLIGLFGLCEGQTFNWDCTNSLGTCQNYCFAARCRGQAGQEFTYDADEANRDPRRTASGCNETPCSNSDLTYSEFGNSCDEFPFASVTQGGSGARLRCVDSTENSCTYLCVKFISSRASLIVREAEGAQLSNFYATIADGTDFGITIENYVGA